MMALGVGVTVQDGRAVVFVHGEIDIASMRVLAQVLRDVVASDAAVVVIDLSGVEFMSTSAVSMLTKARKALVSKGRELRVVAPGGSAPARVLQALRVSAGALPVFPTRAAALAGVVLGPRRAPHAAESVQGPDLS
jgi:anti-sigma B factor antagonist